jgi:hypothetical protein
LVLDFDFYLGLLCVSTTPLVGGHLIIMDFLDVIKELKNSLFWALLTIEAQQGHLSDEGVLALYQIQSEGHGAEKAKQALRLAIEFLETDKYSS